MTAEGNVDEWPLLQNGHSSIQSLVNECTTTRMVPQQTTDTVHSSTDGEDWEMLTQDTDAHVIDNEIAFEIVDRIMLESNNNKEAGGTTLDNKNMRHEKHLQWNDKKLKHCESSPNLTGWDQDEHHESPNELNLSEEGNNTIQKDNLDDASFSYSFVSGPASVLTSSTMATVTWATLAGLSSPAIQPTTTTIPKSAKPPMQPRIYFQKPKFRVVHTQPLRRNSKSLGDIHSLEEEEEDDDDDEEEFYNRKAFGATAHSNGLKLRPDEQARKNIIMAKKSEQRRKQQTMV